MPLCIYVNIPKRCSGAAAQQLIISQNGGWEAHHEKFAIEVGKHISRTYLVDLETQVRQPRLRIIK